MFFSRSRKLKKVADAILVEVQRLIGRLELQINKKINVVSDDDYLLGFIDEPGEIEGRYLQHRVAQVQGEIDAEVRIAEGA